MLSKYLYAGLGISAAVAVGLSGWFGYSYGSTRVQQQWDEQRAAALAETAEALALLAAGSAALETELAKERARKRRVVVREVEVVRHEIQRLPSRDCPVRSDARSLLVRTLCANDRYADHPECVPPAVRPTADAATAGDTGERDVPVGGGSAR